MANRPNIILILNDDMGYSDLGCYGGEIESRNLDGLAANGLRFAQFYNTARCCPSRASLLTGLHPHQAHVGHMMQDLGFESYQGDLAKNSVTIAEVLRQAGYGTYMSGKWHVTHFTEGHKHNWPRQRGFDRYFGIITGAANYWLPNTLTRDNDPIPHEDMPEGFFLTDAISHEACSFIRDHVEATPGKPFFTYVAYTAPHWPLHAHEEDVARYRGRFDEGWDKLREQRLGRMHQLGLLPPDCGLSERDPSQPPWDEAKHKEWQARRMEVYAAQIDRMDLGIGRIVRALEETGQLENTLIFFLADNGGCAEELGPPKSRPDGGSHISTARTSDGQVVMRGNDPSIMPGPETTYQSYGVPWANLSNTPFRLYKHWVHEGGIATPLIVHWPAGIGARGELRFQPGQLPDIMGTCLDVAGVEYPRCFQGKPIPAFEGFSLCSAFGDRDTGRDHLVWEHEGNSAYREGDWKMVRKHPGDWELYDLSKDRSELNNVADQHPDLIANFKKKYGAWAKRCNVEPWDEMWAVVRARRKERSGGP